MDHRLDGAVWRTSSAGNADDRHVQVTETGSGHIAVRDSKNPDGPALFFTPQEWTAFVGGAKDGEFDLPRT